MDKHHIHHFRKKYQLFGEEHVIDPKNDHANTRIWGFVLLTIVFIFFLSAMYTIVVSKFMQETGIPFLDWLRTDRYYSVLVPLFIPVTVIFIYFNWLSMKFFRHN